MKKGCLLLGMILTILLLSGCKKSESLSCTYEEEETNVGYKLKTNTEAVLNGGEVIGERTTMLMTFEEEEWAKSTYDALLEENAETEEYDIKLSGKEITIKTSEDYESALSKQDFKDTWEADGFTCKE